MVGLCFDVCLREQDAGSKPRSNLPVWLEDELRCEAQSRSRRRVTAVPTATLGFFHHLIDAVCSDGLTLSVEKPSAFIWINNSPAPRPRPSGAKRSSFYIYSLFDAIKTAAKRHPSPPSVELPSLMSADVSLSFYD